MPDPETSLLERARYFDLDALGEIYDLYSPGIYRYAVRLLGDETQAEECTAETFSRFLLALKNGGGPRDHLQAYLYRVAHNWITDLYRRTPPPPLPLDEEVRCQEEGPAQAVASRIEQQQVRAALRRLTPEQRQVVLLKFLEGWENEMIAAAIGKPVGAVKSLQHRAVNALRRLLLPEEERYT